MAMTAIRKNKQVTRGVLAASVLALAVAMSTTGCSIRSTVKLRLTGDGSVQQVTYSFPSQAELTTKAPGVPWERFTTDDSGKVTLRAKGVKGNVGCEVAVDDKVVKTEKSAGDGTLTCDYSLD